MTEKTCMNCGVSSCDHSDAMRCSNGNSLWKPKVERDCNTCANHVQASSLDDQPPVCWSCSSSRSINKLPYWKPMSKSYDAAFREDNTLPLKMTPKEASDGSTANYYKLPEGAKELQDLISYKNMNAQVGEMFRACYRLGKVSHSPRIRDLKKIIFYAEMEIQRIEKYGE